MISYDDILKRAGLSDSEVVSAYAYGSRVYGNYTSQSDYDFIFIVKNKVNEQFSDNMININFFDEAGHRTRVINHEISAIETIFLKPKFILKETYKVPFKLDLTMLRHSLSSKSSNSFVKAKKKLTIVEDYDLSIGKKSLWHSFRIIDFGIQIATTGRINDYGSCNELFKEIMQSYDDWDMLFHRYKVDYNGILTEFRKVAPK